MAPLIRIEGENERYSAPLVFLHGLWVGPEVFRRAALGFAHRGWRCGLLDGRGPAPGGRGDAVFAAEVDAVAAELAGLESPPVVVGHDAGGLIALALAERAVVRAAVAVAPLLAGADPLVDPVTRLRARLGLGSVPPPSQGALRSTTSEAAGALLAASLHAEPAARVGALRGRAAAPGAPRVPAVVVAHERDAVVPRALLEVTARGLEADFLCLAGGHWAMLEGEVDAWISPIHRWIVQRLGPPLLLLRGDEDLEG